MVFINKLKNGVGKDSDFELYMPKNVNILMKSGEFSLRDSDIPDNIKKENLKLIYRPNIYTIKRDEKSGKIMLADISTQKVDLPTCLAAYKPEKICPEILFHGFMLCIDKSLENLSEEDKKEISKITAHFKKLTNVNMKKTAKHELKHIENSIAFNNVHTSNAAFSHELYIRKCFIDEISATISENIEDKAYSREDALAYAKQVFSNWMSNPDRKSYYGEHGDFEHQYGVYEQKTRGRDTSKSKEMYEEIITSFLTFNINGQSIDVSAAINPYFELPQSKEQNISNALLLNKAQMHCK